MTLLSPAVRDDLMARFGALDKEATMVVFTRSEAAPGTPEEGCEYCEEAVNLAREVAALSDRIKLEIHDLSDSQDRTGTELTVERAPAWALLGEDRQDFGIRFFGIPSGYEFSTVVADLIRISQGSPDLTPETVNQLARLDHDVAIQVFVTPTCPYCPQAVYLAHQMAMASPRVTADAFEATEFPELVQRYQVRGVPKTILNETLSLEGAVPEHQLLEMVSRAGRESTGVTLGV